MKYKFIPLFSLLISRPSYILDTAPTLEQLATTYIYIYNMYIYIYI